VTPGSFGIKKILIFVMLGICNAFRVLSGGRPFRAAVVVTTHGAIQMDGLFRALRKAAYLG
jgi:hypothetical protein